ncbi:MAG: NAD(P)-binding domain-containing protein [Betaproteobacteria bacterium]
MHIPKSNVNRDYHDQGIPTDRRYAIIGAGASGLCTAKYLKENGAKEITIFEIGTQIGGLWAYMNDSGLSSAYSTLYINTPRNQTEFEDFPFSDDVPLFPHHSDMYSYLNRYAEHFNITPHIKFNSKVNAVRPMSGGIWEITLEGGHKELFDRVIVASGHLHQPLHIKQLQENFSGDYLHSHYYREPSTYVGKRICVVGAGNSAFDICADVCMTSKRTVLVARSPAIIHPKLIFGRPYRDVTVMFERWWIPEFLRKKIVNFLVLMIHGDMGKLGFKKATQRIHNTSNGTLAIHLAYRRVTVKHNIEKIEINTLYFSDGTHETFDVVIAASGYLIHLPFIDEKILPIVDNSIDLYKRIVCPNYSGLYFIGFINTSTGLPYAFERQIQWLIPFERGEALLPNVEHMRSDIEAKTKWLKKLFHYTSRVTLEEPHVFYFAQLNKSLAEGQLRKLRDSGQHWWLILKAHLKVLLSPKTINVSR